MKMSSFLTLSLILISLMLTFTTTTAQDNLEKKPLELPECDIFLFDLVDSADEMKVSNGRNVTQRKGYDNQPWFTPDSRSFLFSANSSVFSNIMAPNTNRSMLSRWAIN